MTVRKVTPGDSMRLDASDFNAVAKAANAEQQRELAALVPQTKAKPTAETSVFLVRNNTSSSLPQFSVLGISNLAISSDDDENGFKNQIILQGDTPDITLHRGRFVVLMEPATPGQVVPARAGGVTQVKVDIDGPEDNVQYPNAEVVDGETGHLKFRSYGSAAVISRASGTGPQWAAVRFDTAPTFFPVILNRIGGLQGDKDTVASWTYDVFDMNLVELDTNVDPTADPHKYKRPDWWAVDQANFGLATFVNGQLTLTWINEILQLPSHEDQLATIEAALVSDQSQIDDHEARISALEGA